MAKGRSKCAVITQRRTYALYSAINRLPCELLLHILEYLGADDLWRAAAVSRAFNAAAKLAGLYIYRTIVWDGLEVDDYAADLITFRETVQFVIKRRLLLSFSFCSFLEDNLDLETQRSCYETLAPFLLKLFSTLTTGLPVLGHLELLVSDHFGAIIGDALRHPAPRLEELNLICTTRTRPCTFTIPVDLFAAYAPKLRKVLLVDVPLGADPIPAFAWVRSAKFDYGGVSLDIDFSRHFPRLRDLHLAPAGAHQPHRFKLDGLSLKKLIVSDNAHHSLIPLIEHSLNLRDMFILEHVACGVHWTEPLWPQDNNDPLSIRLMRYETSESDMSIHVVPEHQKWRRIYHLQPWCLGYASPLAGLPGVSDRLIYLRMENIYLIGLLECNGLSLNALRELQVDLESKQKRPTMLWPPNWLSTLADGHGQVSFDESHKSSPTFVEESYHHVDCLNLERLTLFALDTAMCVDSEEVAFLGRALNQVSRHEGERADLTLMGIEFKKPVAHTLLNQTYAAIRHYEFSGYDSFANHDYGLWDSDV